MFPLAFLVLAVILICQIETSRCELLIPILPSGKVAERRIRDRRLDVDPSQIDPLYQGLGTHYVDLWIGCPPQRQTVIVSTGSGETALPCQGCNQCGAAAPIGERHPEDGHHNHIDMLYFQNESSCFRYLYCEKRRDCPGTGMCQKHRNHEQPDDSLEVGLPPFMDSNESHLCQVSMAYMEGSSWIAVQASDKVYAGGSHFVADSLEESSSSFNLTFGCQLSVQKLFETQLPDGIMGMMNSESSYWHQAFKAGVIDKKQFSLCFTRNPTITYRGTDAGAMVLGGTDNRLDTTPMVFAEMQTLSGSSMDVILERVYMRMNGGDGIVTKEQDNGGGINLKPVGDPVTIRAVVDSGATSTHLPQSFKKEFEKTFSELTGLTYDTQDGYVFEDAEQMSKLLPTLIFQFKASIINDVSTDFEGLSDDGQSVLVAVPPAAYVKHYHADDSYRPRIRFRLNAFGSVSFGANFMTGKNVMFDLENKRIGIAESTCDYLAIGDERFDHSVEAYRAAFPDADPYGADEEQGIRHPDRHDPEGAKFPPLVWVVAAGALAAFVFFGMRSFYSGETNVDLYPRVNLDDDTYFEVGVYSDDEDGTELVEQTTDE